MIRTKISLAGLVCVLLTACAPKATFTQEALDYCLEQTSRSLEMLRPYDCMMSPRNVAPGDSVWHQRPVCKELWTEGFWPGVLWYAYEYSKDEAVLEAAKGYTEALEFLSEQPAYDHDLGFIMFCSYGNGYRLTGDQRYKDIIIASAERLAELWNPAVGTMLSWPREVPTFGGHNTIMDNMINLETLFWAAENGGRAELRDIAIAHADTTMKYHFREDGSCYHVAVYDSESGEFMRGCTHQGYADDSMWARGQAWAIYGYTMCYRFTRDPRYLEHACKVTDVYLKGLPEDMVPYWDFNDPMIPNVSRDASAAAVVASALIELSGYVDGGKGAQYLEDAETMLVSLHENYRSGAINPSFLLHSTGHRPAGSEIDYSIIYADYYYIEALMRLRNL
ncbi:MAG: glycoside hydrolase family 88 protein [Bacteroidales bacterium]|nr:glycoside hydrolase family 88 protein [Bacteroidales bacterium]